MGSKLDESGILEMARRLDSAQLRRDYLRQACGEDTAMLARIQAQLEDGHQLAAARHNDHKVISTVHSPADEARGTVIGSYKLREKIGEGGFGVVYVAEQEKPVRRKVALKIIKPGMDSKDVIARFEAERQALALMNHPNVARVLDAGATDQGHPFFVMELVHGVPITEFCDKNSLSNDERLELFADVCNAVQHAHQKGIIHRDLKPSNIMVTLHDGRPVPKVIDFGVAKALSQQLTEKTIYTSYGQMIGTPVYMSPEQAEMSGLGIDTRSDIYSLGVLLYELLTGSTPLDAKRLRSSAYAEMLRMIREDEPPRPSVKISTLGEQSSIVAKQRRTDPRKLKQGLKGELDWMVMKALEKDRNLRYETASSFAADIKRYLNNEAVEACPPSMAYRVRKFVRRNKRPVIAAAVLMLALCLGLAGTTLGLIWVQKEAQRAKLAEVDAKRERDKAIEARRAEQMAREENGQLLYTSDMERAQDAWEANNVGLVLELLNRHRHRKKEGDFEWYYLWRLCKRALLTPTIQMKSPIRSMAYSPDENTLACGGTDGSLFLVNTSTRVKRELKGHSSQVLALAFSHNGKLLASGSADRTTRIWDVAEARSVERIDAYTDWVEGVAFSPDNRRLATASIDGLVSMWNLDEQDFDWREPDARYVATLAFSPDGNTLATASYGAKEPGLKLRDANTGKPSQLVAALPYYVDTITFSPDENWLAAGCADGVVRLWPLQSDREMVELNGHTSTVHSIAYLDDNTLASGSGDGTVRLWNPTTGDVLDVLKGHSASVRSIAISKDGQILASGSIDQTIKLWQLEQRSERDVLLGHQGRVTTVALSPDDSIVASGGEDKAVIFWDAATGQLKFHRTEHSEGVLCLAFSPDGRTLATSGDDRQIILWDTSTGTVKERLTGHEDTVWSLAFFNDGRSLASTGEDGTVRIWSMETLEDDIFFDASTRKLSCLVISQDTSLAVAGWDDFNIDLWDLQNNKQVTTLRGHLSPILSMEFLHSGRQLATGSRDCTVRLWDAERGGTSEILVKLNNLVEALALSPDGTTLAAAGGAREIKLIDLPTRQVRAVLKGHTAFIQSLAFSRDGRLLVSASGDASVRLWRAASGEEVSAVQFPQAREESAESATSSR